MTVRDEYQKMTDTPEYEEPRWYHALFGLSFDKGNERNMQRYRNAIAKQPEQKQNDSNLPPVEDCILPPASWRVSDV